MSKSKKILLVLFAITSSLSALLHGEAASEPNDIIVPPFRFLSVEPWCDHRADKLRYFVEPLKPL